MSTAQDLPVPYGEPDPVPALRLVPAAPLDFDSAVRRVQPRLQRYAFRRLGDLHEAEELVQEALLRAYSHRAQLLTEDDLAAWATVVTGRLVIDRLRVRGRSTPVADVPEGARVGRDTAEVVVARDEARMALDALDAMPPRQAALLWAREVEGSSYEDLCTRFAMSEPAVRSVLTRARKALRKEYASRGGTLPVGGLAVLAPWVAGLSWADKLRRAATRVTAPAALSALGISALGGLVLSPFGLLPGLQHGTYLPAPAVVSRLTTDRLPHGPNPVPAAVARAAAHPASTSGTRAPRWPAPLRHALAPCVNDTQSAGSGPSIDPRVSLPGQPRAGSASCGHLQSVPGDTLTLNATLPANPTGLQQVGVTSDYLDCSQVPTSPLYTCTPTPSTPGAQQ